ncbi:class I SAM-dependent methyltransferase [Halovivax gelatinilyticus]|uniref:class I SAM-dependent methyltransferase n=1 Tax=Halovivax gelatinilyticus TaxID=2961597 RepID=UPI0020CA831C|nr:class I SAM-dependent methyltransferase [Halovivax gelatinilyticus]
MGDFDAAALPPAFRRHLTDEDVRTNSTLQSFDAIRPQLTALEELEIETIVDVGCNRGGLTRALGEHLGASSVYGIELDDGMRDVASDRGIDVFDVDVETDPFPFADDSVDLVVSFGLLEHLRYYDHFFTETARILDSGWLWLSTPNLGSWVNRVALLTGFQPRNVELSRELAVGSLPIYDSDTFLNHVHAPTYRALRELLELYGFDRVHTTTVSPYQRSIIDRTLDRLFSLRTGWGRRIAVLAIQRR